MTDKIIKFNLTLVLSIIGGVSTLSGLSYGVYKYFDNFATKRYVTIKDLDSTIASVELKVLVLELHGETASSRYERAKARLINLEAQRDKLLEVEK